MMPLLRTTVTLDADTEALVRKRMQERNLSFKQALNELVRQGAGQRRGTKRFRTATADLGIPAVSLDRALWLAGELEDEELMRKARAGK